MELEPHNLNIPLERQEHWGLRLFLACALLTLIAAFVRPAFAIVFAASGIVGLPVLLLLIFPSRFPIKFSPSSDLGRIGFITVLFGYGALAKVFLIPGVIGVIERVFGN